MFYNEVIEELQQLAQDEICITEEEEQEGWIESSEHTCLSTNTVNKNYWLKKKEGEDDCLQYIVLKCMFWIWM